MTYQLNPTTTIYLRRDGNYRFPKADENAFTPFWVFGLKTQMGVSYETGIKIQKRRWAFNINLYQLNLRNEIAFDPTKTPMQPFGANRNLDPTLRRGVILAGSYDLTSKLLLNAQYSYVDPRFDGGNYKGNQIPFVANDLFKFSTDYSISAAWNFYAEVIYTGSEFASNDFSNTAAKAPPFNIYNLAVRYHKKKFYILFRANNITNKLYNSITIANPTTNAESFYPAPGRNFMLTVGLQI